MAAALAPLVTALLLGHLPGLSQGAVAVDQGEGDVGVTVDLVFAHADAALLPATPIVVRAGDAPCPTGPVEQAPVEGDGRSLRVVAACADDGDIAVDVAGLVALPATHRLALRAIDHTGTHDTALSPADHVLTLPRPRRAVGRPAVDTLAVVVAGLVVLGGAWRPRALRGTLGLALLGAGAAWLLRPTLGAAPPANVAVVVHVVAAAFAALGVVVDPTPRLRPAAFALGALAAGAL
ncbi:MAG: hypothetical protein FJ137_08080 [Deltaproteobacteria bacterium]|nr:hypothetical protein [Deltaproteobacteria bacterium]